MIKVTFMLGRTFQRLRLLFEGRYTIFIKIKGDFLDISKTFLNQGTFQCMVGPFSLSPNTLFEIKVNIFEIEVGLF